MRLYSVLFSAVVLATAALGGGCTEPARQASTETGITLPLVQQMGGKTYRLTANFEVTGPDGSVQRIDGTGDVPSVTVPVTPGVNAIQILDGWTLSQSTDGGATFSPVSAVLASMNPVDLVIDPSLVTTWTFEFIVRDATTQLTISFGVFDPPRQLSALLFINGGFGDFAAYTGTEISLATYFIAFPSASVESDGSHDLQYFSTISALEFFGDAHHLIAPLGDQFAGGFLSFTTRIHPDGTQDFSGTDDGFSGSKFPHIQFGNSQAFLATDANGFPADTSFFSFGGPFEISVAGSVVLTGSIESIDAFFPDTTGMMAPMTRP
ncbi:MAG TPA: hypothetical protein VHW23_33635 [Kofleriaceae bacterium]|nr:hypothetical protein [Kofleriaceae bacterium]